MDDREYTIKDIAKLAGVSAGTVDRVLHNRGEVSESSQARVRKVLEEINYHPNKFAIALAAKKKYIICCLIPYSIDAQSIDTNFSAPVCTSSDNYWHSILEGIEKAKEELKVFNVNIEYIYYRHNDSESYAEAGKTLFHHCPDAALIAPNFREQTLEFTRKLSEAEIPFAFVDVNVEGAGAIHYVGQDSYQSGYIAAKILMREYQEGKELALFLSNYKERPSEVQMQRRLEGFMQYIHEKYRRLNIHEVILNKDEKGDRQTLAGFFEKYPQVSMGVVFNSRVYQVGEFLEETGRKLEGLIGYDLLSRNVELLKRGTVTYLIGQRPALQSYCAVKALTDKVVFKKEVEAVKYMPIDILMKDNIDYYFEII